jgi:hypothetical protein
LFAAILSLILFCMSAVSIIAPQILTNLPYSCDWKPLPTQRLSTGYEPSPGRYGFGAYGVLDSGNITVGSHVHGNVTVYSYDGWPPQVWILGDSDYLRFGPSELDRLSSHLAKFTIYGTCCTNLTYGPGFRVGFNFTSGETGSYHFLVQPEYAVFVVNVLPLECGKPFWREDWMGWVWAVLAFVPLVVGFWGSSRRKWRL